MKKNGQYVGVDEKYIPEDEKYVDNSTNNEIKDTVNKGINAAKDYVTDKDNQEKIKKTAKKGLKILKGVGIGYLAFFAFVIIMVIAGTIFAFSSFFKINKTIGDVNNRATEIIDKSNEIIDKSTEIIDKSKDITNQENSSNEISSFNFGLEMYTGTKYGSQVSSLLDNVVTKLKKNTDHSISVVYGTTTTSSPDEIIKLKTNFDEWTEYEVSLDYDSNGFVNKVTILDK